MSPEERGLWRLPEGELGAIHFRAVERIYGDQGPQIVELLKKNPTVAIPVVMVRLEQKETEWLRVREEMNELWRKVFQQNYHKSLDHRSFYFKQSDKKSLMPKAMLQEVRDAADKRRLDERQLQALAAGGSPSAILLQPDLSFDYNSEVVFDDMYQAVVYGIEEQLTGDVRDAVIRFWHTTVEPFFGRQQRPYTQLHTKTELQQLEAEEHAGKASSSSDQEDEKARGKDDGAESGGVTGTDATMTDAAQTPEPGTTPEPDDKGDALAALLAAGAGDLSEHEGDGGSKPHLRDMSVDPGRQHEESHEAEPDRFYNICKPLNTRANAAAAAAAAAAGGADFDAAAPFDHHKQHVLYGNDNHYFFFRLHRHVYDRLAAAQRCAREKNQPQFRQTGDEHIQRVVDPQAEAARAEESARLHREFMGMLRQVLDGHMDSSTFEDTCRALLGTNSYVLFTLDKLIQKFIKHMASMVQDEQSMRLVELHKYEAARRGPVADEVYRANANILLHDEPCYRFAFMEGVTSGAEVGNDHAQFAPSLTKLEPTPPPQAAAADSAAAAAAAAAADGADAQQQQQVEGGQLQLQLLEPDKSELQPLGLDVSFQEYIKSLMASPAGVSSKDRVFLLRSSKHGSRSSRAEDAAGDGGRLLQVLQGVAVANGLECKISCQNSKVSYVLDTEDVMYRQHSSRRQQRQKPKAADGRAPKWQKWLEARCAAMGAAAEAAQAAAAEAPPAAAAPPAEAAPAPAPAPAVDAA
ncbi:hypothetical protein OEZ85_003737 [Tetradesmus obliquus]|nr:hypothetical protein OEZ85_003737 [Tetradesmus obliquus]